MLALLALLAVVVIAAAAGVFRSSVTALADLGDSIRIGLTPGGSYPVKTGIGQLYQVEKLAGGFVELGEKDVVLASASGLKLRTIQHGYAGPPLRWEAAGSACTTGPGTPCGWKAAAQNLYTQTLDNAILVCGMSQNGSLAVATRSNRYTAEVKVYSPNFVYRYGWNTTDSEGTPIRIAFAPDNKRLAVACLRADAGQMTTGIYLLDTRKDAVSTDIQAQGSTLLQLSWVGSSQLLAVYDHYTALYDAATGKERSRFEYGDHLLDASISGKYVGLLLGTKGGATQLVTLGTNLNQLAQVNGSGAVGVTVTGHRRVSAGPERRDLPDPERGGKVARQAWGAAPGGGKRKKAAGIHRQRSGPADGPGAERLTCPRRGGNAISPPGKACRARNGKERGSNVETFAHF